MGAVLRDTVQLTCALQSHKSWLQCITLCSESLSQMLEGPWKLGTTECLGFGEIEQLFGVLFVLCS